MKRNVRPKKCPSCGDFDFEVERDEVDDAVHEQCTCTECGHTWVCVYEFAEWYSTADEV